jgi:hypothetical protein
MTTVRQLKEWLEPLPDGLEVQCSESGLVAELSKYTSQHIGLRRHEPDNLMNHVTELSEPMTCKRRMQEMGPWEHAEGLDRWQEHKSNGDRVCSFCGSLHPVDFLALVARSAAGEDVSIDRTDKGYKIYVRRPSVVNAMEGGIKFYTWHLVEKPTEEQNWQYAEAVRRSVERFNAMLQGERNPHATQ